MNYLSSINFVGILGWTYSTFPDIFVVNERGKQ